MVNLEPLIQEDRIRKIHARLKQKPVHDIGLFQVLTYSSKSTVEEVINRLYNTGMIEYAEPEYVQRIELVPDDSLLSRQYHLELIRAYEAWDITTGDSSIVIAIVDSGVDTDHPDLKGNLWINPNDPLDGIDNDGNGYVDDIHGWDFAGDFHIGVNEGDNDVDIAKGGTHQHGLSVASVAGATANNGIGFAGTGFQCRIMVTKHFADDQPDTVLSYASNPYLGIIYAAENGADIINCSWGSTFRSQFNQDIIEYVSVDLGALVIASSGNSGIEEAHYPSDYKYVLSVSAVNRNLSKTSFTSYGKGVDITAPGSAIAVHENDSAYGVTQGTSFSAPMVSGAAGLVKARYPEFSGIQIGEILRVTANDTIYEVNPGNIFKNKLGKGLLDMEKALTSHPPSIRLISYRLLNDEGLSPVPGEEASFIANFKNHLWPSSNGLRVKLLSRTGMFEVLNDASDLGIIEMGQSVTNAAHPFRIRIRENIPTNLTVDLMLEYEDGSYSDYQFISILLNPTFLNIEENQIASSIAENGRIGYQDTNQSEGLGYIFDGENNLFEMGLMLGNSERQVSSAVRSVSNRYDEEFLSTNKIAAMVPGNYSASEITGGFNDSNAGDSASNVQVNFRTMVWKEAPNDHYFIVEYRIRNDGDSTLNSFYAGLYADWDISKSGEVDGSMDKADWLPGTGTGYVYNTDSSQQFYHGIQMLSGKENYWAIDNDADNPGNPWGVYDGYDDQEKYISMSSGIGRAQAGFHDEDGADVSHTVASGPHVIAPGDSITIAFAIHGASTLEDLILSAKAADTMYNLTLKAPQPVLQDVQVCYEDTAVITASGASAYKWYKMKTGGVSFFDGPVFTTDKILNDTTFFVSNAENSWESVRTPVTVMARANPTIQLSGSRILCDGDTTVLLVGAADSYLWSPGNESTQMITVTESGIYNVTVSDDSLGCISTSEDISIVKNELPSASFDLDKESINPETDTEITLTDQSVNAASWFWLLSDGQTSTKQHPVFTVNSSEPIEVKLTATSAEGCQDHHIQFIDIITGLEEQGTLDKYLRLYPNPTYGQLILELSHEATGPVQVVIYNLLGEALRTYDFLKESGTTSNAIDLVGIARGLYLIRIIQDPAGQTTQRIRIW